MNVKVGSKVKCKTFLHDNHNGSSDKCKSVGEEAGA